MLTTVTAAGKTRQMVFASLCLSLLCVAIAVVSAKMKQSEPKPSSKVTTLNTHAANEITVHTTKAPPQTSTQFDLSRNLIAGGGGTSSAGSLRVEGSVGEPGIGQIDRYPVRDTFIQSAMVCSFITSREYQERFSSVVTPDSPSMDQRGSSSTPFPCRVSS